MDHVMARIKGAKMEDIKAALDASAAENANRGLMLRHIWRNADDPDEIVFIFTATDLDAARKYIEQAHEQVLKQDPGAALPTMLFLKGQ